MRPRMTQRFSSNAPNLERGPSWIHYIPNEILKLITTYLGQPDINSLSQVCYEFALRFQPFLLQRDIDDCMYNSLAWACCYGDKTLGELCLQVGASPNVCFQGNRKQRPKCFVFPTKRVARKSILCPAELSGCSPLMLATRRDQFELVHLLLKSGAAPIPQLPNVTQSRSPRDLHPCFGSEQGVEYYFHDAPISHVRSVRVANALLEWGAAASINRVGRCGYTPLELVLSWSSIYQYRQQSKPQETELYELVQAFLSHGASLQVPHPRPGCLVAAMATGYPSVTKLLIDKIQMHSGEYSVDESMAILIALGHNPYPGDVPPVLEPVRLSILAHFLKAGLPPNTVHPILGSLMGVAIEHRCAASIQVLHDWKADPNFTSATSLAPMSAEVLAHRRPWGGQTLFTQLLKLGADIDQPSFWEQGFTPLMFATIDDVGCDIFSEIISLGADRSALRAWYPGCDQMSVLQCIILGLPPEVASEDESPGSEKRGDALCGLIHMSEYCKDCYASDRSSPESFTPSSRTRQAKFDALVRPGVSPSIFYIQGGVHIINWVIRNHSESEDMEWALDYILPYYAETRLPSDKKWALMTYFSEYWVDEHLAVGTLKETYVFCKKIIQAGNVPTHVRSKGGTLLHRVCKLRQTFPNERVWDDAIELVFELDDDLDFDHLNMGGSIDWLEECQAVGESTPVHQPKAYCALCQIKPLYMNRRLYVIGRLVDLFVKGGFDLYAEDDKGKTAFEYIEDDRVWSGCSPGIRNAEKEAEILGRRSSTM